MIRPVTAGTAALAMLLAAGAYAQGSMTQRFPLNTAIPESGITACLSQEVPIRLSDLMAEGNETEAAREFEQALVEGKCINGAGVVIYTKQVHRVDADDGSVWAVYEASAGRAKFFVPMHGFLHEDTSI
jgi:hypothetical protein